MEIMKLHNQLRNAISERDFNEGFDENKIHNNCINAILNSSTKRKRIMSIKEFPRKLLKCDSDNELNITTSYCSGNNIILRSPTIASNAKKSLRERYES